MAAYYQNHEPPPTTSSHPHGSLHQSSFHNLTLEHSLEDLSARFIVNLPAEELESMDRVCFQIEQAHWYYEDFIRPAALNPGLLPSYGLKAFSLLMFRSCPLLHDLLPNHNNIWTSFMAYKERVPVCGAIIISEYWDKVLLVKGWAKGSSWSFPRGKINKEEPEAMCAVREVLEETGFDMTDYFHPRQFLPGHVEDEGAERIPYYVELVIKEQKIRLYFVPGVKEDTIFETRTRKEISKIDWFKLNDLPTWSKDKKGRTTRTKAQLEGKQAKFYMVTPFISHLKLWIDHHKPKNLPVRNTDLSPRGHLISPPHSPVNNGIYSDHHLHDEATYHLPSEIELGDSTSAEADSTEDELDDFLAPQEPVSFETTQQGTDALTAFFFGSPPASNHDTLPLSPPSRSASFEVASTPPHIAYERQSSFLQPKPQASMNQQTKLLELLSGAVPSPPPPQPPTARRSSSHYTQQQVEQPRNESRSLLHLLNDVHLTASPQTPYESPSQHASPAYQASPLPHQQPHSILFSDSQAPPEAANFGQPLPSHLRPERNDSERKEKHNALLRALFNVATTRPAPSPEEALTPTTGGPGSVGSYAGSSNGDGWTEQDRTMGKGEMDGLTKRGEPYGPAEDDEIWPPPVMRRNQLYPLSSPKLPSPPPPQVFETQPSTHLQYQQAPIVSPSSTQLPFVNYTSPLHAQPPPDIARPLPLPAATSKPNGSSLLSILNGAGGERAQQTAILAPQPSSPYSHHSLLDPAPSSPPVAASSSVRSGKDPLELLKEFRARQLGQESIPPIQPLPPAEPSPSRAIHPPLPVPPQSSFPAETVASQPPPAPLPFPSNPQYSQSHSLPSPHAQVNNLPPLAQLNSQQFTPGPHPQVRYLPFNPHQPPNLQPQFSAPPSNYSQTNQSFYSSQSHFSAPPPPQSFPPQFSVPPPQQSFNPYPNPAQFPPQPQYQQQQFTPSSNVLGIGAGMVRPAGGGGGNAGALLGLLNGRS